MKEWVRLVLAAAVGVVYRRPALLWLYSEFGADYKMMSKLDSTQDPEADNKTVTER